MTTYDHIVALRIRAEKKNGNCMEMSIHPIDTEGNITNNETKGEAVTENAEDIPTGSVRDGKSSFRPEPIETEFN